MIGEVFEMEKNLNDMTKTELINIPYRESWDVKVKCTSFVLIPTRKLHDSGYRFFDYVACNGDKPICKIHGGDLLRLKGDQWQMDCLKKSGYLRMFNWGVDLSENIKIIIGHFLSTIEIWVE